MLGAIAGDVIGSAYEALGEKFYDFELFTPHSRFTDDTVMTVAIAQAWLGDRDYAKAMRSWGARYPLAGYGRSFQEWLLNPELGPYGSYGNGGAMRVSAIGLGATSVEEVLFEAERSAMPTHNHPDGIAGAQATALAIFLARHGSAKATIRDELAARFNYDLDRTVDEVRPGYGFDVAAQHSVPEAVISFLDGEDFESAVRNAVSLGGDADTMACIAGGIAEAYWGEVPRAIADEVVGRLPEEFLEIMQGFYARHRVGNRS